VAQVVTETRGNEEYVHLKSLEDEYEYMESNMPQKEQPPPEGTDADAEEDPLLSPNPAAAGDEDEDCPEPLVEVPEDPPLGLDPDNWSGRAYGARRSSERKGYSGEEDDEDLSPPLSSAGGQRGNLWSSFGGGTAGGDWIPPPRDHRSSSGLEDEELGTGKGDEEELERDVRREHIPAGKRRPDLFESSSSPYPFGTAGGGAGVEAFGKGERKSNQMEGEEEGSARGAKCHEEEGSPFQFYGKETKTPTVRGRVDDPKRWGSEDDID
jgi:hypothetical protein